MKKLPMYVLSVIVLVSMSYVLFTGFSYQQETKIAYIETQKILNEYEGFVEAAEKIEEQQAQYEKEFQEMQDEFVSKREEFEKQRLLLSEDRQNELTAELDRLYRDINDYGRKHFSPEGTIAKLSSELNDPILQEVRGVIKKVGKDLGYDFILDGSTEAVLYANDVYNITAEVMEELKK